jgi:Flp pilus assembly protein TadD
MVSAGNVSPATPAWWRWAGVLLVLLLVVAAYQPVWHAGFVWDDDDHLTANPHLVDAAGLGRIWSSLDASRYYPLTLTSFWAQRQLWGLNPLPYHLVNLAMHLLAGLAASWVLRQLRLPAAGLAVAVWLLHPVNVESVAWITELKNTQSGVFFFLALGCFLRFDTTRDRRWYAGALLAALAAMLSKPSTVVLPAVVLLCLWWQRGRWVKRDWLLTAPFFLLAAAMSALTIVEQRGHIAGEATPDWELGLLERILLAGHTLWFYAGKVLWPVNLTFVYPRWTIDPRSIHDWVPLAGVLALAAGLWARRHTGWARATLFGGACFGVALAPVSGLFDVYYFRYSFVADHFQYLASLGIITLAAGGLATAWARWRPTATGQALVWAGALLAVLGTLTWRQAHIYRDVETLWRDTLAKNPACWMAHNNLGGDLADHGRFPEAVAHCTEALRLRPNYAEAHNNLGVALAAQGKLTEAMEHYTAALRLSPHYAEAHNNLGNALVKLGRMDEAIARFSAALRLNPDSAEAHCNLGKTLAAQGKLTQAITHFSEALRLKTDFADAHGLLGGALAQQGKLPEAIDHLRHALRLQPSARTHYNLGVALAAQGKLTEAIDHYTDALRLEPDDVNAHHNLGAALIRQGKLPEAIRHFTEALRLNPAVAETHHELGMALAAQGNLTRAIAHFNETLRLKPESPVTLNNLAWLRATAADPALRDGAAAVRLAERAVELTDRRLPGFLDTLAAAYAEAGRWPEAVATAEQALALARAANQPALAAELELRLARYRASQPWRAND